MRSVGKLSVAGAAAITAALVWGLSAASCGSVLGSDAFAIGACSEGEHRCANNAQEKCVEGRWIVEDPCVQKTCVAKDGRCAGECAPEGRRCAGEVPEACSADGHWQPGEAACAPGTRCSGGLCLVNCVPGDLRCVGNTPQTCALGGQWQDQASGPCVSQTCLSGECTGECALKDAQCIGDTPQSCDVNGHWKDQTKCAAPSACVSGTCPGPSCAGLPETCGPGGDESCCASPVVDGGTFIRVNNADYPAVLSDFRLDRFEVTVGRFRAFVASYPQSKPAPGAGAHPLIAGSGWYAIWDGQLPADQAALVDELKCNGYPTWSDAPQGDETVPISCVSWFVAFAFCAWDGGRLPTEAEWNYAAAGGAEQRIYPWSNPPNSATVDTSYAVYFADPMKKVGAKSPKGDAKWGQAEMAGNAWEWQLDNYHHVFPDALCVDCAAISSSSTDDRVLRGGNWYFAAQEMFTSTRNYGKPGDGTDLVGVRCARSP